MAFVGDAVRFVTATVDARLVAPVTTRLANSVANPYVLSFLLWDRIKKLTPQRARDLTRLLSAAVANGVGVLGAPEAARLAGSARRLQDELVAATVTPQGKTIVLNGVATASKVAQALHTPETQVATRQLFETLQSLVDFFASDPGRKVIATAGECVVGVCDVLASPEAAVLLAEVATNLCHALEVEALRRDAAADAATAAAKQQQEEEEDQEQTMTFHAEEDKPSAMGSRASVSSADDTALEDDSTFSEFSFPPSRAATPATHQFPSAALPHDLHEIPATATEPAARKAKERSALRSARIEKDVLLKMGVNPSMLEEVQRILDRLREEQAREEAAASAQVIPEETEDAFATDQEEEDSEISSAFGIRSSSLPLDPEPPLVDQEAKTEEEDDGGVILPEWHPEPVRAALRRRHVADSERAAQRTTFEDQSREMAELLARRRVVHGDLAPADVLACRVISQLIIGAFAVLLLLLFVALCRRILA